MRFIADLHIHSRYSLATSKQLVPEYLDYWARLKGITVVGSGDFTHPGWLGVLREKLEPAEQGLYKLKNEFRLAENENYPKNSANPVRFMLSAEVSTIYKKAGKTRKVHNVIFVPDFETALKIQQAIQGIGGNITSDGRPILGLDAARLLELCLECSEDIMFVPAHIWTPWFSVLGSKSGFDTAEACFEDLTPYIHAVETGLSSDPPMNWLCSMLDRFTLISNSDAHSPEKLGRNATIFDCDMSYDGMMEALKGGPPAGFQSTIDMYPQEGKYHYDGHRKCGVCWSPLDTLKHGGMCPVCGKEVTVGVMNRVCQLADRFDPLQRAHRAEFYSLIPLKEILSEILDVGEGGKKVSYAYERIIRNLGPELPLLMDVPVDAIQDAGEAFLAEAVRRVRNREVRIAEGYDGEYGRITVLGPSVPSRPLITFDMDRYKEIRQVQSGKPPDPSR